MEGSDAARIGLDTSLNDMNGRKGDPRSFDALERMLADQAYRLSFWRVAADEINYRRFFDINDLAAIRVEDPEVFAPVHALVFDLVRKGYVSEYVSTIRTDCSIRRNTLRTSSSKFRF